MSVHSTASAGRQRARDRPFAGGILAAGAADRTFNARVWGSERPGRANPFGIGRRLR
ncbi:MAG TPA: hypothetical protein VGD41_17110 [Pyrinomonadaceae bacterium]